MAIYDYSMTIINKGTNLVYPKIFPDFIAMDLSSNNFSGEIPSSVRFLQGLHLFNLSHNVLTGHIPRTLSNITQLEVLDLSYNNLSGTIPQQLSDTDFLAFFNVSYNQLSGSIPQGKQFDTFDNTSYLGNFGLCGRPLSKRCQSPGKEEPQFVEPTDNSLGFDFDWRIILMGVASGLFVGIILGQGVSIGHDNWILTKIGRRYWKGRR
ncbi:hypothetical protein SAY86_010082 [Trapa natans]|uniref:Receptor-like protein 12 n=1 Tax=Trapa natans TaxID=22666 RepID=A0AAN7L5Z1_TRANT|nr:hypothetical protein SAY86_010082 [Trapa natans]